MIPNSTQLLEHCRGNEIQEKRFARIHQNAEIISRSAEAIRVDSVAGHKDVSDVDDSAREHFNTLSRKFGC